MTVTRLLAILLPALVVAGGNWVVQARPDAAACPSCVAWLVGAPFALALVVGLVAARLAPSRAVTPVIAAPPPPPAPPPEPREHAALQLLGLLQEEGRFVDFLQENLAPYSDQQIGAAVRGIHEGCRKALAERFAFEAILRGTEGDSVTVEPGFDAAAVRLTGNVHGEPPFAGVLRHAGWRATRATLPARRGHDPQVVAPAEVELA